MTLALTLSLSACGDDPGKARFVERADAICREARERTRALGQATNQEQLDELIAASADLARRAVTQLRRLEPPPGDRATVDEMLDNIETALRLLPEHQRALARGDEERVREIAGSMRVAVEEVQRISSEYGFEECGSLGVAPAE